MSFKVKKVNFQVVLSIFNKFFNFMKLKVTNVQKIRKVVKVLKDLTILYAQFRTSLLYKNFLLLLFYYLAPILDSLIVLLKDDKHLTIFVIIIIKITFLDSIENSKILRYCIEIYFHFCI